MSMKADVQDQTGSPLRPLPAVTVQNRGAFSQDTLPVICGSEFGSHGQALPMTGTAKAHPGSWCLLTHAEVCCSILVAYSLKLMYPEAWIHQSLLQSPAFFAMEIEVVRPRQTHKYLWEGLRLVGKWVISALCLWLGLSCLESGVEQLWA